MSTSRLEKPGKIVPETDPDELISPTHRVERAAGEFRRGVPILIGPENGTSSLAAAAETLSDRTLRHLRRIAGAGWLLITHDRAETLKIPLYTEKIIALALPPGANADYIHSVADPATDLDFPLKGPFQVRREHPEKVAIAAVALAKISGLLPAALFFPGPTAGMTSAINGIIEIATQHVLGFADSAAASLSMVVRSTVPLDGAEHAELAAFRPADGGPEHYAIIIGDKSAPALLPPGPVLTRIHSECFTGDLLGSLKCDCGDQLRGAVRTIAADGGGILLYLAQEGRGIGLMNKLRAYRLQDEGYDTLEANRRLGFAEDERLYDIAARMLRMLGYEKVRLLTNNPQKIVALHQAGIEVVARVSHSFPDNIHNRDYLRTKARKAGHLL